MPSDPNTIPSKINAKSTGTPILLVIRFSTIQSKIINDTISKI